MDHTFDVLSKTHHQTPGFLLCFLLEIFVLTFTFRSTAHFEVIIVCSVKHGTEFFFSIWVSNLPTPFVEKVILCVILLPLSKISYPYVPEFISGLSSNHWSIYLSLSHYLDYCIFKLNLEIRSVILHLCSSLSKLHWLLWVLCSPIWILEIVCQFLKKNPTVFLLGMCK